MHRTFSHIPLVGLILLALPTVASATPSVTFNAAVVPIPGFPGTGYKLGAGAALRATLTIHGTESMGGVPSPLREVISYLPAGSVVNGAPFATCSASVLQNEGPEACSKASVAGPVGSAAVVDPLAGELIHERATLQAFFAPGGGLNFYSNAVAPISAQVVARARVMPASPPFGQKLVTEVPLVESLPGAPPVSVVEVDVKVGAAVRRGHRTYYYGTVPRSCPRGGFPEKVEIIFTSGEVVRAQTRLPCPRH